ncbi:HupE/UreJ family protein [Pseudoduganella namucuonensis]|uniref:HupE / UreJ protein n=1 Tax=Pseudoduganella namucuonensis TaxID=1035707 RepID=A0A1I7JH21_9BURK|nr:HupE/UreJ family protein [Pseudoduganella namucuonensis]SFU84410.1 HupE / UreJ protein [Pseudoduganella namucuonensis]
MSLDKPVQALLLLLALICGPAAAHKPSDSYLTLNVEGRRIEGQWDIALRDLDFAIGLDADGDGRLTWDEIRGRHPDIAAYALSRLRLASGDAACAVTAGGQLIDHHTDGAYTVLKFRASCPAAPATLRIAYSAFAGIDPQHKGLARIVRNGRTISAIFGADSPEQAFTLATPDRLQEFADYVKHGAWHIWIGYDHILFLISLLLPAVLVWRDRRWRQAPDFRGAAIDVCKIVSAFTLAHSITLSLAAVGAVSLPSRWIESAIAASVILSALNNLAPVVHGKRWLVAFVFGLIHGFGFASVLADLGLPRGALAQALVGFNVGVELGQLAIVAVFLPLAYAMRRGWAYQRLVMAGGSAAILLVSTVWLGERAFDLRLPGLARASAFASTSSPDTVRSE